MKKTNLISISTILLLASLTSSAQEQTQAQNHIYPIDTKPDSTKISILKWNEEGTNTEIIPNVTMIVSNFRVVTDNQDGKIDTSGVQKGKITYFDKEYKKELKFKIKDVISYKFIDDKKKAEEKKK